MKILGGAPVFGFCEGWGLLLLTSAQSRAILGSLDILVDIGVPAEKEVIQ
jgi:hypothetical protein